MNFPKYSNITSILITDSFRTAYDTYEQLRTDVLDFIEKTKQYINSLPITSYLRDKLVQVRITSVLIQSLPRINSIP